MFADPNKTMTSQLLNYIHNFDGSNYTAWALEMESFLQAKDRWNAIINSKPDLADEDTTSSTLTQ